MTKTIYLTSMELRTFEIDEWVYQELFEKDAISISLNRNFIRQTQNQYIEFYHNGKLYLCLYKRRENNKSFTKQLSLPSSRYRAINQ